MFVIRKKNINSLTVTPSSPSLLQPPPPPLPSSSQSSKTSEKFVSKWFCLLDYDRTYNGPCLRKKIYVFGASYIENLCFCASTKNATAILYFWSHLITVVHKIHNPDHEATMNSENRNL
jgi:hypothetical protein